MNSRFSLSAISFALATITLTASPSAFATNIDFSCGTGGTLNGAAFTCPGTNNEQLTAPTGITTHLGWTEDGFQVVSSVGNANWVNNAGVGTPADSIEMGESVGTYSAANPPQIRVSETAGGTFFFDSLELQGTISQYSIAGYNGATEEFSLTCTGSDASCGLSASSFTTISATSLDTVVTGNPSSPITYLNITVKNPPAGDTKYNDHVDNIDVTPSPEPGTLLLLGSGLFTLAFAVRRRLGV
jgi:hypothetical protein